MFFWEDGPTLRLSPPRPLPTNPPTINLPNVLQITSPVSHLRRLPPDSRRSSPRGRWGRAIPARSIADRPARRVLAPSRPVSVEVSACFPLGRSRRGIFHCTHRGAVNSNVINTPGRVNGKYWIDLLPAAQIFPALPSTSPGRARISIGRDRVDLFCITTVHRARPPENDR